jgi:hypothetical protein
MAVNTIDFLRNLGVNTDRGPSAAIWGDCPLIGIGEDPASGMGFFDDFIMTGQGPSATGGALAQSQGQWSSYIYQGGLLSDGATEGGSLAIGSDGDNEGVAISSGAGSFRLVTTSTLALNQKLWFEARIKTSTIATAKHDIFVGLYSPFLSSSLPAAATPIQTTDDTITAAGHALGFQRKGSVGTDFTALYQLANTTTVYPTNLTTLTATVSPAQTLAADTFVKLGFVFDPLAPYRKISSASTGQTVGNTRRALIRFFVNGIELPAFLTSDNLGGAAFPTGFMAPMFAVMNQTGSSPGTSTIDWIRVYQLANS